MFRLFPFYKSDSSVKKFLFNRNACLDFYCTDFICLCDKCLFFLFKQSYLFTEIAHRVSHYADAHPDEKIIRLGIGDVTLPLPPLVIQGLREGVDDQGDGATFKGYGPEQGYPFLRNAIAAYYLRNGAQIDADEVFVSDGAKSDTGNITDLFDKDNVVLVGCPHWDQDIHLVAESPLEGFKNVMYTVHFYAATHGDDLRQRTEDAVKRGIPVFISESGATEASGDGRIDAESEEQWIAMCERLGISWICWSISDKNESCSMLLPRATATGPWADDVIKVYGKLVKGLLEKYNNRRHIEMSK